MSVDQTIKQWLSLLLSSTCEFVYRREAEVLEVIDVQNESFGERMNNSLSRKC